eukprot:CAMPEP_0114495534 /NCGR_PEP_ID=MMETSP0109-20121206/5264_1 /TAXON_ID=29199 /ORGANISM="Chlorarachnion reptans, Strain CCCM449" /LENGTH=109 /DNA_ID=CAMNT_0001672699 /DNA_START=694 /DNA_END=1021 /DNA_ORIENTATION=+
MNSRTAQAWECQTPKGLSSDTICACETSNPLEPMPLFPPPPRSGRIGRPEAMARALRADAVCGMVDNACGAKEDGEDKPDGASLSPRTVGGRPSYLDSSSIFGCGFRRS